MSKINKLRELLSSWDTIEQAPDDKAGDYIVRIDRSGGYDGSLTSRNLSSLSRRDDFRITYIGWDEDDDGTIEEIHYLVDSVDEDSTDDEGDEMPSPPSSFDESTEDSDATLTVEVGADTTPFVESIKQMRAACDAAIDEMDGDIDE